MENKPNTPVREYFCQKGKCLASLSKYPICPTNFDCPQLFSRERERVLCSQPTITRARRTIPICKVYETYRTGVRPSRRKIPQHSPFAKYGYLSVLESSGIDPL